MWMKKVKKKVEGKNEMMNDKSDGNKVTDI